jgi:hypothetical protein
MGAGFSAQQSLSTNDRNADIILAIAWGGAFYGMAMIACAFAIGAIILSIFWPVVFPFLCGSRR